MQRNKKFASRPFFSFGVKTVMVSPYLERPVRTLDRVLEDRVLEDQVLEDGGPVPPEAPRPASAAPVGSPVGSPVGLPVGSNPDLDARRLDPTGVLVRLLMSGHGAEGDDERAPAEVPAASRPRGRRAA